MTIIRKPSRDALLNTIINKGGTSSKILEDNGHTNVKITIRLPLKMLDIIDLHLEQSLNKKNRTSWIKEAAEEKINKEIIQNKKSDQ